MEKLSDKEVMVLVQIDEKIAQYHQKKIEILGKLIERHKGSAEGVVELPEPDDQGKKFIRVRITDNLEKFTAGEPLWRSVAASRYEVEISRLKNQPK